MEGGGLGLDILYRQGVRRGQKRPDKPNSFKKHLTNCVSPDSQRDAADEDLKISLTRCMATMLQAADKGGR